MRHMVVYKIVLEPFYVQHKLSMAPSDNTIGRSYHRGEGKDIQLMLNMILPLYSMHWKLLCNSFKHDSLALFTFLCVQLNIVKNEFQQKGLGKHYCQEL